MQLVPLKDLDVGFLEVKTARQHARDFSIAFHTCRLAEQFDEYIWFDQTTALEPAPLELPEP